MPGYAPSTEVLEIVARSFQDQGLHFVAVVDEEVPFKANLGEPGFDWTRDFDGPYRDVYFNNVDKHATFHYCLFAHGHDGSTSSGRGKYLGKEFLVSLGHWPEHGTVLQQAGTFLHELGHNLGLLHGGTSNNNHKPNYLSVMSYNYQMSGLRPTEMTIQEYEAGAGVYSYSTVPCADIDETAFDETQGIACEQNSFKSRLNGRWVTVNVQVDANLDSRYSESVQMDLNEDGISNQQLKGSVNEYTGIDLIGLSQRDTTTLLSQHNTMSVKEEQELTYEQFTLL
jgi:hypothetical protein